MENESKKPIEAFEVYLDLDVQVQKLEAELLELKHRRLNQMDIIGESLGICEGEYAFTGVDGTVAIVEIEDYLVKRIKVVEKLEVKS